LCSSRISDIMLFTSAGKRGNLFRKRGALEPILIVAIVVLTAAIAVSVAALIYIALQMYRAQKDISEFIAATRTELIPALRQMQQALGEMDSAAHSMREKLERADRILRTVERVFDGTTTAIAMSRALKASGGAATGVIMGIREGIKALRQPTGERKEAGK
jgi:hypothetical protein